MYYAVLRNTQNKELPPALLTANEVSGLKKGISRYNKEGWEVVFAVQGERLIGLEYWKLSD